jgi:cell wall assembly regulator SMI1
MGVVVDAWTRIDAWLARFAPASAAVLAPPADPSEIAAAEAEIGYAFPEELVESLRCHNGVLTWANVLPACPPAPVAQIVAYRQMCMEIEADMEYAEEYDEPWWHELWLPFAEADGTAQVIDLRPGPGYLRVGFAIHDSTGDFDDAWPSLGAYLTEVADVLDNGGAVRGAWAPFLIGAGELWWDLVGHTELNGEPLHPAPLGRAA